MTIAELIARLQLLDTTKEIFVWDSDREWQKPVVEVGFYAGHGDIATINIYTE